MAASLGLGKRPLLLQEENPSVSPGCILLGSVDPMILNSIILQVFTGGLPRLAWALFRDTDSLLERQSFPVLNCVAPNVNVMKGQKIGSSVLAGVVREAFVENVGLKGLKELS